MRAPKVAAAAVVIAVVAAGCAVLPIYSASTTTFEGFPVISNVPQNPRGIVFLFHGTGGSAQFRNESRDRRHAQPSRRRRLRLRVD